MNAIALTAKERKLVAQLASEAANKQADDISRRASYIIFITMLRAGLSPRTVNRVVGLMPDTTEAYAEYRTDQLADYVFCTKLQEAGVQVEMTEDEL